MNRIRKFARALMIYGLALALMYGLIVAGYLALCGLPRP